MVMKLEELFQMQKALDERIVKEKGLEGQELLQKKVLALQVELGELANELPEVLKFWSNKKNNYGKALVELVDCLHFILSIGNEVNIQAGFNYYPYECPLNQSIEEIFTDLISNAAFLSRKPLPEAIEMIYVRWVCTFLGLGRKLGFSEEDIIHAYYEKNEINFSRQENGY
jgi:dimeric dUTPase (all-alpha-NTP-PPase superfamily)